MAGRCVSPLPAPHLTEVLGVVLRGHKHHRLVLGPHHSAQQVEEHGGLGVLPHEEEGGLQGEGSCGCGCRGLGRGSALGHRRGLTLSCSLSLVSTSSRMSTGSVRPAGGHRGRWGVESLKDTVPRPPVPGPALSSLTGPGKLHQHFWQRGGEQDRLVAPGEAADDLLQLLCKPHLEEPGTAEGRTGSGEGLTFRQVPNLSQPRPYHAASHLDCCLPHV